MRLPFKASCLSTTPLIGMWNLGGTFTWEVMVTGRSKGQYAEIILVIVITSMPHGIGITFCPRRPDRPVRGKNDGYSDPAPLQIISGQSLPSLQALRVSTKTHYLKACITCNALFRGTGSCSCCRPFKRGLWREVCSRTSILACSKVQDARWIQALSQIASADLLYYYSASCIARAAEYRC